MTPLHNMKLGLTAIAFLLMAPSVYGKDWYGSVSIGGAHTPDSDFSVSGAGLSIEGETELDNDIEIRMSAGRRIGTFRVELEGGRSKFNVESNIAKRLSAGTFLTITLPNVKISYNDSDIELISGHANLWFDFDTGTKWRPFLGGGIGITRADLTVGASDNGGTKLEADDTSVSFQFGAGVSYALTDTTFIDFSYRYSKAPNLRFEYTNAGIPTRYDTEAVRHSALFGLRLLF